MGEMADFILDGADYFDDDTEKDQYGNPIEIEPPLRSFKTCRYCNKSGLTWEVYQNKWRLFEGKEVHRCPKKPLK